MELVSFTELAGVPIHWGRWDRLGSRKLDREFKDLLEVSLEDLWTWLPPGKPRGILSGGAYVPPPHEGRHSEGVAFDLSGFRWAGKWSLHKEWKRNPREALGIEAILRRHHSQILGPWYDFDGSGDHTDHWHIDNGGALGFQLSSSCDTRFLQACLNHFWSEDLKVDGDFGELTAHATKRALESINQTPAPPDSWWGAYLEAVWRMAFNRLEAID